MKAQDIMSKNPSVVTPETPVRDAARLMKDENVGVVPVVESESSRRLVGIVTDRDIAIRVVAEGKSGAKVREAMSADVRTLTPDASVKDVMKLMGQEQVRRVPIVDDRGTVVGIVSQADIVLEGDDDRAHRTIEKISQPGGQHTQ